LKNRNLYRHGTLSSIVYSIQITSGIRKYGLYIGVDIIKNSKNQNLNKCTTYPSEKWGRACLKIHPVYTAAGACRIIAYTKEKRKGLNRCSASSYYRIYMYNAFISHTYVYTYYYIYIMYLSLKIRICACEFSKNKTPKSAVSW